MLLGELKVARHASLSAELNVRRVFRIFGKIGLTVGNGFACRSSYCLSNVDAKQDHEGQSGPLGPETKRKAHVLAASMK